jgi:L-seryl-tRNA(Ser) seleniumtransferase
MIATSPEQLRERAEGLAAKLVQATANSTVVSVESTVGGGSLPGQTMPSFAVSLSDDRTGPDELAKRLRLGAPRVFARVADGTLLLDLRTVLPEDDARLTEAVLAALTSRA